MTRPEPSAVASSSPPSRSLPSPGTKPTFRGDVQGLRAIAVLVVIADHAGLPVLPGGFVGVDVFFVISGFLISSLLFREVDRDGRVSLRDFYARRARRILPAATLVTLVTVVAASVWISVVDALDVVTDAIWATLFAANFRFISVGTDYNAQEQGPSPLQHYWSLSVEEQFYLFWPLILIGCLVLARRRTSHRPGRRTAGSRAAERRPLPRLTVFWVLAVIGLASFAYGVWVTSDNPTAAYFSSPARAWELALGALAALVAGPVARRLAAPQRAALALVGLLAIAAACTLYSETTPFPGVAALLPVLGSAAVLVAGAGGHDHEPWPMRALSVRPMRVIGDWSYSLYLWHWPLLVLPTLRSEASGDGLSAPAAALAVVATFGLAALTYRFVETPLRSPRTLPRPSALALYPASVVVVAMVCALGSLYSHYRAGEFGDNPAITVDGSEAELADAGVEVSKDPTIALVQASVVAGRDRDPIPSELSPAITSLRDDAPDVGACDYETDVRDVCPRGDTDADRSLVVLGNSHGRMWIPAFEKIAQRDSWTTYYFVKPNCTAADLLVGDLAADGAPWTECSQWRDWAFEQIAEIGPDVAVVSTSGPNPVIYPDRDDTDLSIRTSDASYDDVVRGGFADTFTALAAVADRVVLLRDIPKSEDDPAQCLGAGDTDLGDCMFPTDGPQLRDADLSVAAAEETGTTWVDPTPWICWDGTCPAVIGSTVSYRDRGHLTTVYAAELDEEIGQALGLDGAG